MAAEQIEIRLARSRWRDGRLSTEQFVTLVLKAQISDSEVRQFLKDAFVVPMIQR